ncbi:hypothetical protein [Butyrivibrio sp. FCS006]|uniref:hypothetical protein n=1 Tax=Butyrivibrio sp. FCS006 TaxID=1280684 RepID=UPI000405AE01|nr:hypothetical protein [Butyrivibrio sp. FCS006]
MTDEILNFMSEVQARMDELSEKLETLTDAVAKTQTQLIPIEHRLSKTEKKVNDIASIKIYRNIIEKDIKRLSKEVKEVKQLLEKETRKNRKIKKDLSALAKLLRLQLQKRGILLGKKASLKKICSRLTYYPTISQISSREDINEL